MGLGFTVWCSGFCWGGAVGVQGLPGLGQFRRDTGFRVGLFAGKCFRASANSQTTLNPKP